MHHREKRGARMAPSLPQLEMTSPRELWTLIATRWRQVLLAAILGLAVGGLISLFSVPQYQSVSTVQVGSFRVGKAIDSRALVMADTSSERGLVNSALAVLRSKRFLNALAQELRDAPNRDRLVLSWGVGRRLRFTYALSRLKLASVNFDRIDSTSVELDDLGVLVGRMIELEPNFDDLTVQIRVLALEPSTAFHINSYVVRAFISATDAMNRSEIEHSIGFFNTQLEESRRHLNGLESNLKDFLSHHPGLNPTGDNSSLLSEYNLLAQRHREIQARISARVSLLDTYRQLMMKGDGGESTTVEMIGALQNEIGSLDFQKARLQKEGYPATSPAALELDERVAMMRGLLADARARMSSATPEEMAMMARPEGIAQLLAQAQAEIKSGQAELQANETSLREVGPEIRNLSANTLKLQSLTREVKLAGELLEELSRRLQLTKVRGAGEEGSLRELNPPQLELAPVNARGGMRILFAGLVGALLWMSILILGELVKPKVHDARLLAAHGLRYVGCLNGRLATHAVVLAQMGLLDKLTSVEVDAQVVLVTMPNPEVGFAPVLKMTGYLARHRKRSVIVHLAGDKTEGTAPVEKTLSPFEKLIQLPDIDVYGYLSTHLSDLKFEYDVVFLVVPNGADHPSYPLIQKSADRLLILGEVSMHPIDDYLELAQGFGALGEVRVALTMPVEKTTRERVEESVQTGVRAVRQAWVKRSSSGKKAPEVDA